MKTYGKTGQFSQMIKAMVMNKQFVGLDEDQTPIYDKNIQLGTSELSATVKLHGTNAGIRDNFITDNELSFQSKTNVLSIEKDNCGFVFTMSTKLDAINSMMDKVRGR